MNRNASRTASRNPFARIAAVLAAVRDALAARLGATRRDYALALAALDAQRDCVALAVARADRNAAAAREHDGARLAALAERDAAERRATEAEREAALARAEAAEERARADYSGRHACDAAARRNAAYRERDELRVALAEAEAFHKAEAEAAAEQLTAERLARGVAEDERHAARVEAATARAEAVDLRAELATERDNAACERGAREAAERRATEAEAALRAAIYFRDAAAHEAEREREAHARTRERAAALAEALTLAQGGC